MTIKDAIAELRNRNEPVPKPLRLPTVQEVAETEAALGVSFPVEYRQFLLEASDVAYGTLEPAVVVPNAGHLSLVPLVKTAWSKMGVPTELLPFCEDNGDYYCLKEDGTIVFWSHNGISCESWSSLASWIAEIWLADVEVEE